MARSPGRPLDLGGGRFWDCHYKNSPKHRNMLSHSLESGLQGQGVGRPGAFCQASPGLWKLWGLLKTVVSCVFTASSLCVSLRVQAARFHGDTSQIGGGFPLMTSSYLDHLQRAFSTGTVGDECSIFWTHNSIRPVTWGKAGEDAGEDAGPSVGGRGESHMPRSQLCCSYFPSPSPHSHHTQA